MTLRLRWWCAAGGFVLAVVLPERLLLPCAIGLVAVLVSLGAQYLVLTVLAAQEKRR